MKKLCFLILMISTIGVFAQSSTPDSQKEPFMQVEKMPEFPGGPTALMTYLGENLKYPKAAMEGEISGTVYVRFIVEEDGSVNENVEVLRGIGYGCDEEATRVITQMPNWSPGESDGKNVRVYYTLPIKYRLN